MQRQKMVWKLIQVNFALPLAHNIVTIDTAEVSKQSLLAAVHLALLSSATACKISKQKLTGIQHKQCIKTGQHMNNDELG